MSVRSAAPVAALLLVVAFVIPAVPAADAAQPRADIDLEALADELPLTIDLDVDQPRHVLGGDGEVFVTADDELLVLDLDGDLIGYVDDLPGAGPMALSPDGEFLFVGLRDTREVVLFDVEELDELWAWDVPARPRSLLATDEFLHVGVGQTGSASDRPALITILADEGSVPLERPFSNTPLLARDEQGLIVGHAGVSPARVSRRTIEAEPLEPPLERTVGGQLRDVQVDEVTGALWIAGSGQTGPSYSVHALDPVTLATTRSIPLGAYPNAVAPLGDGNHLAAGRGTVSSGHDVSIHRLEDESATLVAGYALPGRLVAQGLAVTTDGTLAMLTERTASAGGWLTLLPNPDRALPELVVDATAPLANQPIAVTGTLRQLDGNPVADAEISVIDPRGEQVHTTTDASGAFLAVLPAAALGVRVDAVVVFPGDPVRHPVIVEQPFTPRRIATHLHLEDRVLVAGHAGPVRGRVVDELGSSRADLPVTLSRSGVVLGTATTDADGWFSHPVEFSTAGTVTITATVVQDSTHAARTASKAFEVVRDVQDVRIDAATGTARSAVTLTGHVRDGLSRPVVNREVVIVITDDHGSTDFARPITDAGGHWTATFTPQHGGNHQVTASARADNRYAEGQRTRVIKIARVPTTTTLASLPTTVDHGAKLTLTGRVAAPPSATLDLVAVDLATGKERRVARGLVDSRGRFSHEVTARANTRYEARFRGDATYAPSSARRTVKVRATVTAKVSGHDRTVDGVPSFPKAARPTLTGRVRSADPTGRVHVHLQQRRDGAWVTAAEWRARPDADGRITTRVPDRLGPGRYRARISTSQTPANLVGRSPWVELRVRK